MATNNTTAPRAQRSAAAKRGQATRNTSASRAQRSAAAQRGQATRKRQAARRRTAAARSSAKAATTQRVSAEAKQAESIVTQVTGVAESAILVPVGAALEARDRVLNAIQPWTKRTSAERELGRVRRDVRRFERRGTVARNRVVRELRKRRNAATRQLRRRRNSTARFLRLQRNGAQRSISKNGRQAARLRTDVEKAVKPQVDRVQKELQQQTRQARERVQQFV